MSAWIRYFLKEYLAGRTVSLGSFVSDPELQVAKQEVQQFLAEVDRVTGTALKVIKERGRYR